MKYWSGLQPLTEENSSGVSQQDINSTMFASQVIVASYSTLFYLLLLILSILGICYKPCVKIFTSQANLMLFLIGALLVFVNIFAVEDQLKVKTYFRVATGFIIGIAFTISGAFLFFTKADDNNNHCTLERQQPSMGLVVATITIPLIIAEVFLIASTFGSEKLKDLFPRRYDWVLTISDKLTFLVQKIVQAIVYIILRYKVTSQHYRESARFYFQILSFFNFVEWVDSQVNENNDVKQSGCKEMYGPWFDVFSMFYRALIIDYRLLCSLLFLEHSLEDEHEDRDAGLGQTDAVISRDLTLSERKLQSVGFIAGFTSLSAPICCGLYYVKRLAIPPGVHVFAIFVNLEIIVFGTLFLLKNDLRSGSEGTKGSFGVNFMVCFLGAVGFACWMVKAAVTAYWAGFRRDLVTFSSYFSWVAAKYVVRGITVAFLIGLFLKVDARTLPRNLVVKLNHFLVPILMLTILGTFLETLIDQYVGPLDSRLRNDVKLLSLNILFNAGPPMYLGFMIHLFLHFVIIRTKISQQPPGVRELTFSNYGAIL